VRLPVGGGAEGERDFPEAHLRVMRVSLFLEPWACGRPTITPLIINNGRDRADKAAGRGQWAVFPLQSSFQLQCFSEL
jgi:hypothetical protein